jgi:hypothetical protein
MEKSSGGGDSVKNVSADSQRMSLMKDSWQEKE